MKEFFGDDLLLGTESAKQLFASVRDLPIIDYHCHLDQTAIKRDDKFEDIGQLWLAGDHYKWRAMRMCGVDEKYITGNSTWKEKFIHYAEILPRLAGGPLYYWTHLELKQIFGICEPLNGDSAERIYDRANKRLAQLSVRKILDLFKVEFVATTDDPAGDLSSHGKYGNTLVTPTFRPDKLYAPTRAYLDELGKTAGMKIDTLGDLLSALTCRLDYFKSKGCRIADHGFRDFPKSYASEEEAARIFASFDTATAAEKDAYFGFITVWLAKEYKKRGMTLQLHFSVTRNVNPEIYASQGVDRGCDVFTNEANADDVIALLARFTDEERPDMLLYTLNPNAVPMLAAITGAFRGVRMGAAWWFNDTACGIRENLSRIAEYACLGTHTGMLTDSRSFSSYSRFDFFRRLLCDYVGGLVERGEYDMAAARRLVADVCYNNIKSQLGL